MADIDVLRLAASGYRLRQIAEATGLDLDEAQGVLGAAARDAAARALDTDGQRQVELAHLDLLRTVLTPMALRGDASAVRTLVRIHDARALLLGLTEAEPVVTSEKSSALDELRRRRLARRAAPD